MERDAQIRDGKLTESESDMILKKCLISAHASDPNVLKFIAEFVRCEHTGEAARAAGLTTQQGQRLRMRPDIHECIRQLINKSLSKFGFDASEVVRRVFEMSDVDPIETHNSDGTIKALKDMDPAVRRCIVGFDVEETLLKDINGMPVVDPATGKYVYSARMVKVKFADKLKANELLGREKGVFKETKIVQHDITNNMAQTLLGAPELAQKRIEQMREAKKIAESAPAVEIEYKEKA